MRLRHLDLVRYGRFTDRRLDFGAGDGETDVTLVYGENEAGKSTAFSAWLDLLFGLPHQHPYDFLHARKDLLVGATLDTGEGPLTLRRTGQRQGSLTDDNGRVVDERRLSLLLHGLDRDGYRTRFSLDDEVLRRGGEEIARAKGDLGQLLHAGSSGLSGFAELLKSAEAEVDGFHKPRGRTTVLAEGRHRLKEIDAALAEARLDPRRYESLRQAVEAADQACREAEERRDAAKRRLVLREAADHRRDLGHRITSARERLAGFPDGPDLPEDAWACVSVKVNEAAKAADAQAEAEARIEAAQEQLSALDPDPKGREIGEMLADLEAAEFDDGQSLIARASTADADIARRRQARDEARTEAARLAAASAGEGAEPSQVILPRDLRNGIRQAAQDVLATTRSRDEARQRLAQARSELGEIEEMPDGADALSDALEAFDALPEDPQALARALREREADARHAAASLPPSWRDCAEAGLPTAADLRRVERELTAADAAVAAATDRLREATEKRAAQSAEREGEAKAGAVVTDEEVDATRGQRDRLWADHRAALDAETAEAFEAAMRADDATRDRHARSLEARTRLARLDAEGLALDAEVARRATDVQDATAMRAAPLAAAQRLAAQLGLDDVTDPAVFAERREALNTALQAALVAEAAAQDLQRAQDARKAALERLAQAYGQIAGDPPSGEDLLAAARRLRSRLDDRRARIASRQEAAKLVQRLERDCDAQDTALETALSAYEKSVTGLWCAELSPEQALRIADDLADLTERHREAEELDRRVSRLNAARAAFATRASRLCAALGMAEDIPVDDILRAARQRAATAKETARKIETAQKDAADAVTERDRKIRIAERAGQAIDDIFRDQQLSPGDDPLAAVRHLLDRDRLRTEVMGLEADRRTAAQGFDPAVLSAEEADTDPVRTEAQRDAVTEAEAERDAALGQRGEARQARDAALGAVGGVDQAQARAALLEELREAARHAALTRIGLMAASGALRRLREDRRGSMLQSAERAFARMTGGEWPRLEAQPTGTGERLVGIRDGQAVAADAMSTGTRGQLYLALRVAGHADFTSRFGPLPFVTDDILETFDDSRAAAALALVSEMGRSGQAIMFTHHRHLVDLGREVIPGLSVVELA